VKSAVTKGKIQWEVSSINFIPDLMSPVFNSSFSSVIKEEGGKYLEIGPIGDRIYFLPLLSVSYVFPLCFLGAEFTSLSASVTMVGSSQEKVVGATEGLVKKEEKWAEGMRSPTTTRALPSAQCCGARARR
jgi:hypothetical protein